MKVLLSGADGFIGKHLLTYLKEKNVSVIGTSRKISNKQYHKISFFNKKNLQAFIKKHNFDVIIHLAALIKEDEPNKLLNNNSIITQNLLKCSSNINKFIFISSHAVYGQTKYLPIDEEHPSNPLSNYAFSKIIGENLCKLYGNSYGFDTMILRVSSVYGEGQSPSTLIPSLILNSIKQQPLYLHRYNNGYQIMDLIHVHDVCRGIYCALKSKSKSGTYNIATGKPTTVYEISEQINKINPSKIIIKKLSSDTNHFLYDVSKAKNDLGFKSQITLKKSLNSIFSEIQRNKSLCQLRC